MKYRPEIDGLRALAIVSVILFHAGFKFFSGGYLGVDVFFVISGYLITTIIYADVRQGEFCLLNFYERRARRILPALFVVMSFCVVIAYFWMLPDELENFGQSVVATVLFSNNILLFLTSGYWELASEFKPLLHTWSLGVEEQYYIFFPLVFVAIYKVSNKLILPFMVVFIFASFLLACWLADHNPQANFYLLPSRAWELLAGATVALIFPAFSSSNSKISHRHKNFLGTAGLGLVLLSIVLFDSDTPNPSIYTILPILGTVLIVLFAIPGTWCGRLLSNVLFVRIGLISYSAYLWHFPLFSFSRIYSKHPLGLVTSLLLIFITFALGYLSWRYIETPFRNKGKFGRKDIFLYSCLGCMLFVILGLVFHKTHGLPSRIYEQADASYDEMYIGYNERNFSYKKDAFVSAVKTKMLVVGNSFGRDFINMLTENFDLRTVDIVYRDDFTDCLNDYKSDTSSHLIADADIIVFSTGDATSKCISYNVDFARKSQKHLFYIGTKHFGYNLNWLARLKQSERKDLFNDILPEVSIRESEMVRQIPSSHFISIFGAISVDGKVPVTDSDGYILSPDRVHLTKRGAIYVGQSVLFNSPISQLIDKK